METKSKIKVPKYKFDNDFKEDWNELTDEEREELKEIVIARIKNMPDNLRLNIL